MRMELFIELHDHAAYVHKKNVFKFGSDATLEELKEGICSVFNTSKNHLNLISENGVELEGLSERTLASFVQMSTFWTKRHKLGPASRHQRTILLQILRTHRRRAKMPHCFTHHHYWNKNERVRLYTYWYIATKWDDKFELMEQVIRENSLTADIVVQLVLLRVLLFIADLHLQNCGVWKGTNNIAIVDFAPENEITFHDDIKAVLFTTSPHARWKEEFKAVKNKLDDNSWLKIAKQSLDKWDLSRKIELAQEQLDPTKDVLKGMELGFERRNLCYSPTDQLKQYIDILNKNLENLQIVLNSIVHLQ